MKKSQIINRAALLSLYSYRNTPFEDSGYFKEIKGKFLSLKLILSTDESKIERISEHHYKCDAWIDNDSKTIIFASVGTRFNSEDYEVRLIDTYNDIQTIRGILPDKTSSIIALNEHILSMLNVNQGFILKEWSFEYTGHSLGGHFANIGAIDMFIKTQNLHITTIVFDDIGTKKIIEKICFNNNFDIEDLKIEFISIRGLEDLTRNQFKIELKKYNIYRLDFGEKNFSVNAEKEKLYDKMTPSCINKLLDILLCCCRKNDYKQQEFEKLKKLFSNISKEDSEYKNIYDKLCYNYQIFLENVLYTETVSVNAIKSNISDILDNIIVVPYNNELLDKYKKEKKIAIEKIDIYMEVGNRYKAMSSQKIYCLVDKDSYGKPKNSIPLQNEKLIYSSVVDNGLETMLCDSLGSPLTGDSGTSEDSI
jgi:hypothetical protein